MFRDVEALFRTGPDVLEHLKGQTVTKIDGLKEGSERVTFYCESGDEFVFFHAEDCCETVEVSQIDGEAADLIGAPLVMAEEVSSEGEPSREEYDESFTWTFYKFATSLGYVTVRWYGTSNGYYSERVAVACKLADKRTFGDSAWRAFPDCEDD